MKLNQLDPSLARPSVLCILPSATCLRTAKVLNLSYVENTTEDIDELPEILTASLLARQHALPAGPDDQHISATHSILLGKINSRGFGTFATPGQKMMVCLSNLS